MPPRKRKDRDEEQHEAPFDRVPPHSIDAERSVLGAMLINPDAVGDVTEILRDSTTGLFYVDAHQRIYNAILQLFKRNVPVDAVTLTNELRDEGALDSVGGVPYLGELVSAVPTSANVEYYAKIVLDAAVLRRLISTCTRMIGEAYENASDVSELLDKAESEVFRLAQTRQTRPIRPVSDYLEDSVHRIEEVIKSRSGVTGLSTGVPKLDEMLAGFQKSDMLILAARPSVGKTAFALNIASNIAVRDKKGVLLFSIEMGAEQLVQRLICMEGAIDSRRLRTGFLANSEFSKVQNAAAKLQHAPIYIDDTPGISILEIRAKARRHIANEKPTVELIIIDYLQLITSSRRAENRQVEISEISRSIKGLARELRVPVLALCQLSREAEKDDSGSPKLSHLRESGAIEQDADVVMFLSRAPGTELETSTQTIRVDIGKQRNGPTGRFDMLFDRNVQKFKSLADGGGVVEDGEEGEYHPPAYEPADGAMEEVFEEDDTPF